MQGTKSCLIFPFLSFMVLCDRKVVAVRLRKDATFTRKHQTEGGRVDSEEEENVPIMDALEDVLKYSNGAIASIRPGSTSRHAFKRNLDEFFNSIPTLEKATRIKAGRYRESFNAEYSYLANMSFMEGRRKMSSRADEHFERDMDSWLVLSFIQTDMMKLLRLRDVSLKLFHEGRPSRFPANVQGFTPEYKKLQARREEVQGKIWVGLSMITFCNLLGTLGYATHAVAEMLKHSKGVHGLASGLSAAQLGEQMHNLAMHGAQYGNYLLSAHTYAGMAMAIADKMADEEAKALVRAGPSNVLAYWPDTELGHMFVGYTAVNSILHSTLGESNKRPVVTTDIIVDKRGSKKEVELKKGVLLGSAAKFGELRRVDGTLDGEDAEIVRLVWKEKITGQYASAWADPDDVASAARYCATEKLRIWEAHDGLEECTEKNEYIYPGEVFYIVAKDCTRCGLESGECMWKLGDGRGWIHDDGCGTISDPLGSEDQVEEELDKKNLLGNRTAGKLRNINLSTGAAVVKVLTYTVLGIGTAAFALASFPAFAGAFLGGAVLGFLASILPVLKGLAIASSVFTALDSAASAAVSAKALQTIDSRAFLAQAALAHWERHLWEVKDCDITDAQFCSTDMICLRGGAFFRRAQYSPRGRCIPGKGNFDMGKCIIHKDCASGYCHYDSEKMRQAQEEDAQEQDIVKAMKGRCRRACKLGSENCKPIGPKLMFGLASTQHQPGMQQHSQTASNTQANAQLAYVLGQTVQVLRSSTKRWELATVTGTLQMVTPMKPAEHLQIQYASDSGIVVIHREQLASVVKPMQAKAEEARAVAQFPVDAGIRQKVPIAPSQKHFKYIRRDASVLTGGTLLEASMTSTEAMTKCKELPGCRGFSYQGSASSSPALIYFKDNYDMQSPVAWTSYQAIEALAVPSTSPRGRITGVNTTNGHTNLIAAFPRVGACHVVERPPPQPQVRATPDQAQLRTSDRIAEIRSTMRNQITSTSI